MKNKNKERRYRLPDSIATLLGLEIRPDYKRYTLTKEQEDKYLNLEVEQLKTDGESNTETNQYMPNSNLSAIKPNGLLMDIDEYCLVYQIPREDVKSYKLVTHTGTPYYNIASGNVELEENEITLEELKSLIQTDLKNCKRTLRNTNDSNRTIVVSLADLHFGAYVDNLLKTKPFSIDVLVNLLAL